MNTKDIIINKTQGAKLLAAANGDAALLYLYLESGNRISDAQEALKLSASRLSCAEAALRQLGLWQEEKAVFIAGERPSYSETDVIAAVERDGSFRSLYGEVQRLLGRSLNTEELKILLGFVRYLGLGSDVISVLICYCKERSRQRGSLRNPSLRTIEKEAYAWAEMGIDTIEDAAAYIQKQNQKQSRMGQLMKRLQIRGRNLTPGEEKYASAWLEMGFEDAVLESAYEKTCLNTGGLNWAYMNKILTRWHEAGIHTARQLQRGEKPPVPTGATGQLGAAELEAIAELFKEG